MTASNQARVISATIVGALIGGVGAWIALQLAGGGHGTYVPAAILFPYSMLIASALGEIAWPLVVIALLQFPFYGYLIGANRARRTIVVVHVVAAIAACIVVMTSDSFR